MYKPAQVVFKGSGYYVTDNKSAKKTTTVPADTKEEKNGKSESKSESTSETKSEKKSETKSETTSESKSKAKT